MSELAPEPIVWVFATTRHGPQDVVVAGVCDDGEFFASHWCSSMFYAEHDIVGWPDRKARLAEKYPDGHEVRVLPEGQGPPAYVAQRNKAWAEAQDKLAPEDREVPHAPDVRVTVKDEDNGVRG